MDIGLKLWSTNDFYIDKAVKLYSEGVYNYIELFVVPDSLKYLNLWEKLRIPYILHAPHSYSGFNPAKRDSFITNLKKLEEIEKYRYVLEPNFIIFHPGVDGEYNETIYQFKKFKIIYPEIFSLALIENKPKLGLEGELCVGSSPEEIKKIQEEINMGFCYDIGHSFCYACTEKINWKNIFTEFLSFKPQMFHLSDGNIGSEKDQHLNFGKGDYDFLEILKFIPTDSYISIETEKSDKGNLQDFYYDAKYLSGIPSGYYN